MSEKITVYLENLAELDSIAQQTNLTRSKVLDELVHLYGDKFRTMKMRRKMGVSEDDFRESPEASQYRQIMGMNRT